MYFGNTVFPLGLINGRKGLETFVGTFDCFLELVALIALFLVRYSLVFVCYSFAVFLGKRWLTGYGLSLVILTLENKNSKTKALKTKRVLNN